MPSSLLTQISSVVFMAIFALALWRGGPAERWGAIFTTAALFLALLIHDLAPADLSPLLLLGGDALLAGGFLFLAVRYASLWLGAAMIFQAGQFILHAIYTANELRHDNLYARINNGVTIGIFAVILFATLVSWRRRSAAEAEPESEA